MIIRHVLVVIAVACFLGSWANQDALPTAIASSEFPIAIDSPIAWEEDIHDIESLENRTIVFILTHHEYFSEEQLVQIMRAAENQVYLLGLATIGSIATFVILIVKLMN